MRITELLTAQHRLIEQVAGSLAAFVESPRREPQPALALESFCRFFEEYADAHHHAMEEDILLRAALDAGLPEKGPIAMIRGEHTENRDAIRKLRALAAAGRFDDPELAETARLYCARLWEHIDKEDSVLFPELDSRLVLERTRLDSDLDAFVKPSDDLVALGESLVRRFPPRTDLPGVFRGEGCAPCRHYGADCQGVEREWWSDLEWENFHSRDF